MSRQQCTITYNGEIYNYRELRETLQHCGWSFQSTSDTEVLLVAYLHWGIECLSRLNGMFAFVIHDAVQHRVFAARDRFGIKPLYYREDERQVQFVSEIKQLCIGSDAPSKANGHVLANFLLHRQHDYSADTFFKDIKQVEPGHFVLLPFDTLKPSLHCWYSPLEKALQQTQVKPSDFSDLFESAVSLRMRADVEVGSCLSGGLDSTSIVATADRMSDSRKSHSIKSVTASFAEQELDEWPLVQKLADCTRIDALRVRPVNEDFYSLVDQVIQLQDEPIWSISQLAQHLVFQAAQHSGLKVMLDGQGSDEILLGYGGAYRPYLQELLQRRLFIQLSGEARRRRFWGIIKNQAYKILPFGHTGSELDNLLTYDYEVPSLQTSDSISPTTHYSLTQLGTHLRALLHYEDRNSMAFSIETRLPFLDYRLVEFVLALDARQKLNKGFGKWILRQSMADRLPPQIVWNSRKLGFQPSFQSWFAAIKPQASKLLQQSSELGLLDADRVHQLLSNNHDRLWQSTVNQTWLTRLYMICKWVDIFQLKQVVI
jgi:asparagine synthase (glutamine-hydrolysing)